MRLPISIFLVILLSACSRGESDPTPAPPAITVNVQQFDGALVFIGGGTYSFNYTAVAENLSSVSVPVDWEIRRAGTIIAFGSFTLGTTVGLDNTAVAPGSPINFTDIASGNAVTFYFELFNNMGEQLDIAQLNLTAP